MDFTPLQFVTGLGQFLLVVSLVFFGVCALTSYLRFEAQARRARQLIETGEGSPDLFEIKIAERLGLFRRNETPFGLMLISGSSATEKFRAAFRKTDVVMKYDDQRIAAIINTDISHRPTLVARFPSCAGTVFYPEHGDRAELLHQGLKDAASGSALPAIERAPEMAEPGDVDELTGVMRSDRIEREFQKFVGQLRKDGKPVAFLYLDVDYLKKYNTQYGEPVGDQLLKELSLLLQANVRETDLIGRCGDDEFLIGLDCSHEEAVMVAKRLLDGIKKKDLKTSAGVLHVTVSIGLAVAPEHGLTGRHLYRAAEAACRFAKVKGRNIFMLYDESMSLGGSSEKQTDVF